MRHYFSETPESNAPPRWRTACAAGVTVKLASDEGIFSKDHLDPGSRLLVESLALRGDERLLDLGAGNGALGLLLKARQPQLAVTMTEINPRAAQLARLGAEANGLAVEVLTGDGLEPVRNRCFDVCVVNPPIRAGKSVYYAWFASLPQYLVPGGALYVIIRKSHGADSLAKALARWYADVRVINRDHGYRVLMAVCHR